jgi:steroid 5-alpha reductase family enzyme
VSVVGKAGVFCSYKHGKLSNQRAEASAPIDDFIFGKMTMIKVLDANYVGISILVTVGMQLSFFFVAYTCQFDKVTDLAGSANFVLLALLTFFLSQTQYTRQIVITSFVCIWGARLGSYLLYRVLKRGKDDRFDEMREKFWSFLGFWIFQILWVFIVSLPVIFVNAAQVDVPLNAGDYIGWAIWAVGFLLESSADYTKDRFSSDPQNKGKILQSGVWSVTRHPNYAGEIFVWIGIFITSAQVFNANDRAAFASIVSPIFTFVILMFLSGVNLAEDRYDERYGALPEYMDYKNSIAPLIPFPKTIYRVLPSFFKCLFCCEFPMYSQVLNKKLAEGGGSYHENI